MKEQCLVCNGQGKTKVLKKCSECNGLGVKIGSKGKISLTAVPQNKCDKCKGKGKSQEIVRCTICNGRGYRVFCDLCGKSVKDISKTLCPNCERDPVVYQLALPLDEKVLKEERALLGKVIGSNRFGVQVDLGCNITAEVKSKNIPSSFKALKGSEVVVRLVGKDRRGEYEAMIVQPKKYRVVQRRGHVKKYTIAQIKESVQISDVLDPSKAQVIMLRAEILEIRQTSGPTSFTLMDENGDTMGGAGFSEPGKRAFPEILENDVVDTIGYLISHKGQPQLEILEMTKVPENEATLFRAKVEGIIDERASVDKNFQYLVPHPVLEGIRDDMIQAAKRIRKALLTGQNIILRYHAPCVDGACAGLALEIALDDFLRQMGKDPDDLKFLVKKMPQKSPYFDFVDAARDMIFALEDQLKFGDKLPLFVICDFGSSLESSISYETLRSYDVDIVVLDHHVIEPEVKEYLHTHVNPYYVDPRYLFSGGMLAVELAHLINPNPEVLKRIIHLAAIAGVADRVEGEPIQEYIKLAERHGYDLEKIQKVALATDFVLYHLKFTDGAILLEDILGTRLDQRHIHEQLVNSIYKEAKEILDRSISASLLNLDQKVYDDVKLVLSTIDVEKYAMKFSFPPPGKTTGTIHDHVVQNYPEYNIVTLGLGPDFVVFRSKGLIINFPNLIKRIKEAHPETGIEGGGHEYVGSLKFFEGTRDIVLQKLRELVLEEARNTLKQTSTTTTQ